MVSMLTVDNIVEINVDLQESLEIWCNGQSLYLRIQYL
jgi:hypothetical protein